MAVQEAVAAALELEDLTIEYSSGGYMVRPIDKLSLRVDSGELVLLLGASGCGKTTLLSALASLLTPASGSIRLGGTEVTDLRGPALTAYRRRTIGVVFQAFNLIPSLTAEENVRVPLSAAGIGRGEAKARAEELLEQVGLTDRRRHRPADLSGGQQQRVAIARALALDPPLLLADEPTAHLDYIQVEGVLGLVRGLARPGRIVVVATHDDRLLPLADRVVELTPRSEGAVVSPSTVKLRKGEVLFSHGDPGSLIYVVEHGAIELVRQRADGGEHLLDVVTRGRYFGELAPVFGIQRSATARAKRASILTGYSVRDFRRSRPEFAIPAGRS